MSKDTTQQIAASPGVEALLHEFALAEAQLQQAKDAMAPLRKKLLALFPSDQVGKFQLIEGKWQLDVEFPDKFTWDAEELAAYYGAELPAYVKRSFNITDTDFRRLPQPERDAIQGARVQGVGSPKISLIVNKVGA